MGTYYGQLEDMATNPQKSVTSRGEKKKTFIQMIEITYVKPWIQSVNLETHTHTHTHIHPPKSVDLLCFYKQPLVYYKLDVKMEDFKIENKAIDTYLFV